MKNHRYQIDNKTSKTLRIMQFSPTDALFALTYRLIDKLLLLLHRKTKYTHITFNERYIKNIKI